MNKAIFRFAPSPNGELHLGHAYSALLNLKMARESGGKSLLRIEDIDTTRCNPQLESQMLRDLEWIGFEWDEAPRRQSEHFDEYAETITRLEKMQLLYPSTLSRGAVKQHIKELQARNIKWPNDPDGAPLHPGIEKNLDTKASQAIRSSTEPHALRLNMEKTTDLAGTNITWNETGRGTTQTIKADPSAWGDVIMVRKDTPASYHLCCVMDDALQRITHIVRGQDLYHATSIHRLLQIILELPQPVYHHHRLILDKDSQKLSKSHQHTSLQKLRTTGVTRGEIGEKLGFI